MSKLKNMIFAAVDQDLSQIEKALIDNLKPHFNLVFKIANHILFSGGKRIRPLLMVLSSRLCGYDKYDQFKYSTIFEYLHTATLLHDDVVDGAKLRRGNIVANHLWDIPTVLLIGDFLLSRSIAIAACSGMCSIVSIIGEIAEKMSQGEIHQLEKKKDFLINEKEYLEIISCKTAIMFKGACKSGAILACANSIEIEALSRYGYNLGMAFQMADDLLDYTEKNTYIGKNPGIDLKEGKLTMPVIFSMTQASQTDRKKMELIASAGVFSKQEFDWFVSTLNKYGGIEHTKKKASKYVDKAKEALTVFENNEVTCTLNNIANYALNRKS